MVIKSTSMGSFVDLILYKLQNEKEMVCLRILLIVWNVKTLRTSLPSINALKVIISGC